MRSALGPHADLVKRLLDETGSAMQWLRSKTTKLTKALKAARRDVRAARQEMLDAQEAHEATLQSAESAAQTRTREMRDRLAALELKGQGVREQDRFKPTRAERALESDIAVLDLYDRLKRTVLGLHSVTFHGDKTRVQLAFEGLDFMLLLPAPDELDDDPDGGGGGGSSEDM